MNCRPGDIAIVFRCVTPSKTAQAPQELRDRIVKVESCVERFGEVHWNLAEPVLFTAQRSYAGINKMGRTVNFYPGDTVRMHQLPDACLRPIRDPGDDAVDEISAITKTIEPVTA